MAHGERVTTRETDSDSGLQDLFETSKTHVKGVTGQYYLCSETFTSSTNGKSVRFPDGWLSKTSEGNSHPNQEISSGRTF